MSRSPIRRRGATTAALLAVWLLLLGPATAPHRPRADQPPSGRPPVLGFQINATPSDEQPRNLILDRARDSGAAWVRHGGFDWAALEPTEGTIDLARLAALDTNLAGLAERGLQVQASLLQTPTWAEAVPGSHCGPIKPEKLDAFKHFVDTIVRRYAAPPFNVHRLERARRTRHGRRPGHPGRRVRPVRLLGPAPQRRRRLRRHAQGRLPGHQGR